MQEMWKGVQGANPYKEPQVTVTSVTQARKKGIESYLSGGEGVKWLQWELAYQRSCKITADGLAGKTTRKNLSAA